MSNDDDEIVFVRDRRGMFVQNADPVVAFPGYVEVIRDGRVVGRVDARFDFSGCPPEHHEPALRCVIRGFRIAVPPVGYDERLRVLVERERLERSKRKW